MKLTFTAQNKSRLSGEKSVDAKIGSSILENAELFAIDLDHSCGGNCACSTCHVYIEAGMENLSPMQEDEKSTLETAYGRKPNSRLGCQTRIQKTGDVKVCIPS